jgi:hypothetical protein
MTKRYGYATFLRLALSVRREERCEVFACFHVIVKMYRYSLEEQVFIVKTYWITGSIKNCQRRLVEQFGGRNPPSKSCIQLSVKKLFLSFRVTNFLFANSQNTQPHFITGMTCKCTELFFFLWTNIFWGYPRVGRTVILQPSSKLVFGGTSFESWLGLQLSSLRLLFLFLNPWSQMQAWYLKWIRTASSQIFHFSFILTPTDIFLRAHSSIVVQALCYKLEGRGIEWNNFFKLPNSFGYTRCWGLLRF